MTDDGAFEARVRGILNRHPAVGLAVGVVRGGQLTFVTHGLADIASGTPVTQDTVFRIGSITKTMTAVAVLQLVEQGLVDLDAPVAEYLRAYRLLPADQGWRPVTLRHLLTHTAGIAEVLRLSHLLDPVLTRTVEPGRPVPSLAEFYRQGLRIDVEPGTVWRYAGDGFATAGQVVEDVTGLRFDAYLREHVLAPLGMVDTDLVRSPRILSRLATGYRLGSRGPRPVHDRELVIAAAGGVYSTPRDIARYATALMGGGGNRVLRAATLRTLFAPHYRPDPRIPGMGLAFFRGLVPGAAGGHLTVEHGGVMDGFTSALWLAPGDGVAVLAFTNGSHRPMFWLPAEMADLLTELLGEPPEAIRTDVPHRPEVWSDLCGRYWLPGALTDVRARGMAGAGVEVVVRGGRLLLRVLTPVRSAFGGVELHPDDEDDPAVFRVDLSRFGLGTARVVFSSEPGRGTTAVHVDRGQLLTARKSPRAAVR